MMRRLASAALAVLMLSALMLPVSTPASAQGLAPGSVHSPVLTIDSERLFLDSAFGRKMARDIEAKSATLAAENRRIEAELSAEEQDLTRKRPTMVPEEFRKLADAFDEKVQSTRRTQEAKSRALTQEFEQSRVSFLKAAVPVLEDLMRSAGAAVVLERRSVFLSANAIDITTDAVTRLDEVLGDGSGPDQGLDGGAADDGSAPGQDAPDSPAPGQVPSASE